MRFPVTENVFGCKIIQVQDYEIRKKGSVWVIDKVYDWSRCRAAYIYDETLWEDTPEFPNMMQAYRFLKKHWTEML